MPEESFGTARVFSSLFSFSPFSFLLLLFFAYFRYPSVVAQTCMDRLVLRRYAYADGPPAQRTDGLILITISGRVTVIHVLTVRTISSTIHGYMQEYMQER